MIANLCGLLTRNTASIDPGNVSERKPKRFHVSDNVLGKMVGYHRWLF
jgi:hypothetical protein